MKCFSQTHVFDTCVVVWGTTSGGTACRGKWVTDVPFMFLPLVPHLGLPSPPLCFLIATGKGLYSTTPSLPGQAETSELVSPDELFVL